MNDAIADSPRDKDAAPEQGIPHPWDDPPAPDPTDVVAGWAHVPQEAYDDASSGGWGGPDSSLTGPIPRIPGAAPIDDAS